MVQLKFYQQSMESLMKSVFQTLTKKRSVQVLLIEPQWSNAFVMEKKNVYIGKNDLLTSLIRATVLSSTQKLHIDAFQVCFFDKIIRSVTRNTTMSIPDQNASLISDEGP